MMNFKCRIVPVLGIADLNDGVKMCRLLAEGGLPAAEITFRKASAEELIRIAVKEFPGMQIGAGTVLDTEELLRARDAGASFAVAPGFNPEVAAEAAKIGMDYIPGVCTPTELETAYRAGCRVLKFFPAEAAGGVKMLKAMLAPYKKLGIKFMPTGGVSIANAPEYLALDGVAAVGGTWLAAGIPDWEKVAATIAEAAKLC